MAEYRYSSTTGDSRCISSMNSTSLGSNEVRIPAKSPGLSNTGPLVILNPTPSSLAMMFESVVFPSPGGPCSKVWSSGSPRYFAASTNTSRFSTTFFCPLKSWNRNGRRAFSKSFSADDISLLMSKSSFIAANIHFFFLFPPSEFKKPSCSKEKECHTNGIINGYHPERGRITHIFRHHTSQ